MAIVFSSNGCEVIDLDGNKFIDFSLMGVGTNTLVTPIMQLIVL